MPRWWLLLPVLCVGCATRGPKTAYRVLYELERRFAEARTIEVRFDTDDNVQGVWIAAEENRIRLEFGPETEQWRHLGICDGARWYLEPSIGDPTLPARTDERSRICARIVRAGFTPSFARRRSPGETDPPVDHREALVLSDVRWGPEETVDGCATRRIDYSVSLKGTKAGYRMQLWINATTGWPLKRSFVAFQEWSPDGRRWGLEYGVEYYRFIQIDVPVDPARFSLESVQDQ